MLANFFRNLSIRTKLFFGPLIISGLVTIFAIYLLQTLQSVNQSFHDISVDYNELKKVLLLEVDNRKLEEEVKTYILTGDPRLEEEYNATSLELDRLVSDLSQGEAGSTFSKNLDHYQEVTARIKGTELLILAKVRDKD